MTVGPPSVVTAETSAHRRLVVASLLRPLSLVLILLTILNFPFCAYSFVPSSSSNEGGRIANSRTTPEKTLVRTSTNHVQCRQIGWWGRRPLQLPVGVLHVPIHATPGIYSGEKPGREGEQSDRDSYNYNYSYSHSNHHYDPVGPSPLLQNMAMYESLSIPYQSRNYIGPEQEQDSTPVDSSSSSSSPSSSSLIRMRTMTITRISSSPHIFHIRGLLSPPECQALIDTAYRDVRMENASITEGDLSMRTNCTVAFLPNVDVDVSSTSSSDPSSPSSNPIAAPLLLPRELGRVAGNVLLTDEAKMNGWCEELQLVHYFRAGGKFDLHHDGLGRGVTCLYYLNGVGNTWFPFAATVDDDVNGDIDDRTVLDDDEDDDDDVHHHEEGDHCHHQRSSSSRCRDYPLPQSRDEAVAMVEERRMRPGWDGLLVAGEKSKIWKEMEQQQQQIKDSDKEEEERKNENDSKICREIDMEERGYKYGRGRIIKVQEGDAIAFFGYKSVPLEEDEAGGGGDGDSAGGGAQNEAGACRSSGSTTASSNSTSTTTVIQRDWASVHAGLPTTEEEGEKYIANHWMHFDPFEDGYRQD